MTNAVFLFDNYVDRGTIAASSTFSSTTTPASNLLTPNRSKIWRAANAVGSATVDCTLSASETLNITHAAIVDPLGQGVNQASPGTIRLQGWTDAIAGSSLVYDQTHRVWDEIIDLEKAIQNLVVNGSAEFGDNRNFTGFTYDATDGASGKGCFSTPSYSSPAGAQIPVNIAQQYEISAAYKCSNGTSTQLLGYTCLDLNGVQINVKDCFFYSGTRVAYYQAYSAGATVVRVLKPATAWQSSNTYMVPGVAADGLNLPISGINITAIDTTNGLYNTITLSSGIPANVTTADFVANSSDSAAYQYVLRSGETVTTANVWENRSAVITGVNGVNEAPPSNKFRRGTVFVQFLFLSNYNSVASTTWKYDDLKLRNITAITEDLAISARVPSHVLAIPLGGTFTARFWRFTFGGVNNNFQASRLFLSKGFVPAGNFSVGATREFSNLVNPARALSGAEYYNGTQARPQKYKLNFDYQTDTNRDLMLLNARPQAGYSPFVCQLKPDAGGAQKMLSTLYARVTGYTETQPYFNYTHTSINIDEVL